MSEEINPLCARCAGSCCKMLSFPIKDGDRDFWEARGVRVENGWVHIPHRCPKLTQDGLCSIYDNRPLACRKYRPGSSGCLTVMKIAKEEKL